MWIFIFWTPCMAKIAFYWLGLSILEKKVSQNAQLQKGKLFRSPNILIMTIYLIFFTKICGFSFFGHPVWLEQPFIGLVYPFLNKVSQNAQLQKGKLFRRPNILIMSIYLIFSTKICGFSFFGHPVQLKYSFIDLVYSF